MALRRMDEDLGSIKEDYKLMINPQPNKLILLFKYPNRKPGELYCDEFGNKPLELRIKPKCGLIEVDIPILIHENYNREKGLEYGAALRKKALKGDSNSFYGLSSGLDFGKSKKDEEDSVMLEVPTHEKLIESFEDANNQGHVMNKITLGGRVEPFKDGDPLYMLATFEGEICTWTPLNGIVMLRPQFEHLDAIYDQKKTGPRASHNEDDDRKESKAEDVNMTVKDTEDDEPQDDMYGGMAETMKTLRAMADEPWQRIRWIDSEDDQAYTMWEETLVFQNPENALQLVNDMTPEQYLDAISCPRIDPINKGRNIMRPLGADPDDFGLTDDEDMLNSKTKYRTKKMEVIRTSEIIKPEYCKTKFHVEFAVQMICKQPQDEHERFTKHVIDQFKNDPDYQFFKRKHHFHMYFLLRYKRNMSGNGWNLKRMAKRWTEEEAAGAAKNLAKVALQRNEEIASEGEDAADKEMNGKASLPQEKQGQNHHGDKTKKTQVGREEAEPVEDTIGCSRLETSQMDERLSGLDLRKKGKAGGKGKGRASKA